MIRGRVIMRARAKLNDAWWSDAVVPAMIHPGEEFSCNPERAAELLARPILADLVTFDADDVAAIASFTADPADTMLKLSLATGLRPD
jgi:hypothetical protein